MTAQDPKIQTHEVVHVTAPKPQETTAERHAPMGVQPKTEQKHLIIIHGHWDVPENMHPLGQAVTNPPIPGWTIWYARYDATWQSFATVGHQLAQYMRKQTGYDFTNTIYLAYSEGGLVARQMIADGFPCRGLVTICTPHEGVLPLLPAPDPASQSMCWYSQDLKNLNANATDAAHRCSYHCFAITYTDHWGGHDDDTVTPANGALMVDLGQVAERGRIPLSYGNNWWMPEHDPHLAGRDPGKVGPVVNACRQLMESIA